MNLRFWLMFILLIPLALFACTPANTTPTPTIIPLDESGKEITQPEQEATATATATPAPPTATLIPYPSNTPTRTPFPSPELPISEAQVDPASTAVPSIQATSVTPAALVAQATPVVSANQTTSTALQVEIVSTALNIRQGPGINYPVVAGASAGDRFEVIGTDPTRFWLQVRLADGRTGWVSGKPTYTRLLGSPDALPTAQPVPAPVATPITPTGTSGSSQPVGSTAGDRLVFTTGSGGDLYIINADGSNLRHLAAGVIDPVVSPDGRQVAFIRWDGVKLGTLYTINLDGSGERVIVGGSRQARRPTWSPDGQQIIFSFQHGGLVNPEEQCREFDFDDTVRLPDDVGEITKYNVTPDGIHICYIRREDLQWSLRQVNVQSGEFKDMSVGLYSYSPAWDPNQPWRVVYAADKGLMQLDVNQDRHWALTTDPRDTTPVFSPDGRMLALTYKQHDHWEVYTLDPASGARNRLTKPPILANPQYNSASPAWSPDGSQISFLTDRTGRWEIWVMNVDGSNQHPLLPSDVQAQLTLAYNGVHEHLLNWIN